MLDSIYNLEKKCCVEHLQGGSDFAVVLSVAQLGGLLGLRVILHEGHGFGAEIGGGIIAQSGIDLLHLILVTSQRLTDEFLDGVGGESGGRIGVEVPKLRVENIG